MKKIFHIKGDERNWYEEKDHITLVRKVDLCILIMQLDQNYADHKKFQEIKHLHAASCRIVFNNSLNMRKWRVTIYKYWREYSIGKRSYRVGTKMRSLSLSFVQHGIIFSTLPWNDREIVMLLLILVLFIFWPKE